MEKEIEQEEQEEQDEEEHEHEHEELEEHDAGGEMVMTTVAEEVVEMDAPQEDTSDESELSPSKKRVAFGDTFEQEFDKNNSVTGRTFEEFVIDKTKAAPNDEVDNAIVDVTRQFTVPFRFKKIRAGTYIVGGKKIFVRILRKARVMEINDLKEGCRNYFSHSFQ